MTAAGGSVNCKVVSNFFKKSMCIIYEQKSPTLRKGLNVKEEQIYCKSLFFWL
jgi:hypothetical protein